MLLFDNQSDSQNFDWMLALGRSSELKLWGHEPAFFEQLDEWLAAHEDWRVGYLSYDLRTQIEYFPTAADAALKEGPLIHLWVPLHVIRCKGKQLVHLSNGVPLPGFLGRSLPEHLPQPLIPRFLPLLDKEHYIRRVQLVQEHIQRGDIYEINFCSEWRAEVAPEHLPMHYHAVQQQLQAPFSAYMKTEETELLCSSPERFLQKRGQTLKTQPIKGTAPRKSDPKEDQLQLEGLQKEKEQSENVMIVDLVRNDLSRIAQKSSVRVEELMKAYTFRQVHQLISTISCELKDGVQFSDILKATFPMGSMTGAPKFAAIQLAQQYEPMQRGLYSGSVGYFTPEGDFDFNVVIRSMLHNLRTGQTCIRVGSAITWDADAESEWEECQWKLSGLLPSDH